MEKLKAEREKIKQKHKDKKGKRPHVGEDKDSGTLTPSQK
jgi:hypothetical protein